MSNRAIGGADSPRVKRINGGTPTDTDSIKSKDPQRAQTKAMHRWGGQKKPSTNNRLRPTSWYLRLAQTCVTRHRLCVTMISVLSLLVCSCAKTHVMTLSQEFEQLREINRKGAEDVADIFLGNGFIGLATGVVCDAGHCSWISENGQVMRSQIDSIDAIRFFNFGDGYQRNLGWHLGVSAGLGMVAGGTVASNTQDFSTGEKVAMTLLTGALVAPIGLLTAAIQDPENSLSSAYTTFLFRDSPEVRRRILFYERPFGWQRLDRYTKPSR